MGTSDDVTKLKNAYRHWNETKGKDTSMWIDLFAPNVRLRSLAGGRPGLEFTMECNSTDDVKRYFAGLTSEWEMIHYTTDQFAVDGDRVVMLGSTSWKHRRTARVFDTPKADLIVFRGGRIVEFFEFYDTEMVLAAARPTQ
jgi:uncharacterized protein